MKLAISKNRKQQEFVEKWPEWVKGPEGKNWAAAIEGPDKKYKLARRFLTKIRNGREKNYDANEFVPNQYYQFCSIEKKNIEAYTGFHDEEIILKAYFKCLKRTTEYVEFEEVEMQQVIDAVQDKKEVAVNYLKLALKYASKEDLMDMLRREL